MNGLSIAGILALTCFLAGCATAPPRDVEKLNLAFPNGWQERASQKPIPDTSWVESFHDPKLTALVDEALLENRNLQTFAGRIKSAEATAIIAGAPAKPQVSGRFDGSRNSRNFIGFPFGGGGGRVVQTSLSNSFGLALNISWEIDLWGRVRAARRAALADLEATTSDYESARLSLAAQTAKVWFALLAEEEQRRLARTALVIFRETEETIRAEFEQGIDRLGGDIAAELQLAMADVETARSNVYLRDDTTEELRRQLEVLLGRYPTGDLASGGRLPGVPGRPPAGIPSEVLDRRPDLVAAERRLAAADKRVLEARRSLLPTISLTGSYGTSTPEISEILNGDFTVWNIANNLAQPLLDGRRLLQSIEVRKAEADVALAEFQQTALTAFQEVETALSSEKHLTSRQSALQEAVRLQRGALDRARANYREGTGDVLTILRAQQQLIQSESTLIEVRRARLENRVDLHLALGGSFEPHPPEGESSPSGKP